MTNDYLIVLFKNKVRYKIIKDYKTYKNALNLFNQKLKENEEVLFDVKTENGRDVKYEIALIEKTSEKLFPVFRTDEMGRNITIELDDSNYSILKINDYKTPEKLFNVKTNEKIDMSNMISKYIKGDSLKLISKLNNKIIIQDDDKFNLFSCKSIYDADRFLSELESHMMASGKRNCMIVKDTDKAQKKYLYEVLSNEGFDKKMLYRSSTTHLKDK
jgi:hypothetical protein